MGSGNTKLSSNIMTAIDKDGTGRFLDVDAVPQRMRMAIEGYESMPLVSLEEAVMPLLSYIPTIENKVALAKRYAKKEKTEFLPVDQHAAIKIYTMEWVPANQTLYYMLNEALRDENRDKLKPWFLYLKLLLTALSQLPSTPRKVFRGVKKDLRDDYPTGTHVIWWSFSSSTSNEGVLKGEKFLGARGKRTLFTIEAQIAKDIKLYSQYKTESELLLPPARQFEVLSCYPRDDGLVSVHMREINVSQPLINLLEMKDSSQSTASQESRAWNRPSRGLDHTLDRSLQWSRDTDRITGTRRPGSQMDQLNQPCGLCVHDTSTIYVADSKNHRIVAWSLDERQARLITGLRGKGKDLDQLDTPMDVIVNQRTNRLIICDTDNRRIVSCSLEGGDEECAVLVRDVSCEGLTVDEQGYLYFSDSEKHEVRRVKLDQLSRTSLAAGGHGRGNNLDQLSHPTYLFIDREGALYIADSRNHRVMKWSSGAKVGEIVAGGHGEGDGLDQLCFPNGIVVDNMGTVYVADTYNNRIVAWSRDAREGVILKDADDGLSTPHGLSFDHGGNLYVTEWKHGRITKFAVDDQ